MEKLCVFIQKYNHILWGLLIERGRVQRVAAPSPQQESGFDIKRGEKWRRSGLGDLYGVESHFRLGQEALVKTLLWSSQRPYYILWGKKVGCVL